VSAVGLPHLIFLTVLFVAGIVGWKLTADKEDHPAMVASAIIVGLAAGIFMGAWL